MDCTDWLQSLAARELLCTCSSAPANVGLVLIDGVGLIDRAVGLSNSPQKLAQLFCLEVEAHATDTQVAEIFVHFDQTLTLPFARPVTWDASLEKELRDFLTSHQTPEMIGRLAACLHGEARTTEWPRPVFKTPAGRSALWRHPLFEWQLIHAVANELMVCTRYPKTLQHLTAVSVPVLPQLERWDETWKQRLRTVGRIYTQTLESIKFRHGTATMEWTKGALAMLHLGYGYMGTRQWMATAQELSAVPNLTVAATDVYQQMAHVIYNHLLQDHETALTVFVAGARDEALPAFLLLSHRVRESRGPHALRLFVEWKDGRLRERVDLTATYERLRSYLEAHKSFTVPDLYVAMAMQNSPATGARARETTSELVWEALHQEFVLSGNILSSFRARADDAFSHGKDFWYDQDRPVYHRWCTGHVSDRNFAAAAMAVAARCFLDVVPGFDGSRALERGRRESDAYIHVLYQQTPKTSLPIPWQELPPLLPVEALARARRAAWLLEYACTPSLAREHAFAVNEFGESVWGFAFHRDDTLLEEGRLFDLLFSSELRLRDSSSNALTPLTFGQFKLTDAVILARKKRGIH